MYTHENVCKHSAIFVMPRLFKATLLIYYVEVGLVLDV